MAPHDTVSTSAARTAAPDPGPAAAFGARLGAFSRWREELIALIGEYQAWVEKQGLASGEDDLKVYELLDGLRADKLMVALVAEFSRGKTELINALFFADYGQRLLPSEAGRTTMCPTEIGYDDKLPPGIRLLPIDTRRGQQGIAELKRAPAHWTVIPLDTASPKQMAEALHAIVETRAVTVREAEELGLYDPRARGAGPTLTTDGRIEIPQWRHAIINFPHPLLKQGLVVLDTPGLNSLGTEPELTVGMLPQAHAVLFVLAADTGVTKSDLEVWNGHVCVAKGPQDGGRFAVLNKIDTLWDELRVDGAYEASIARQVQETAQALGIARARIYPVSAQKGLLARIKGDGALLGKSGLLRLEAAIADDIVAAKQALLRAKVSREIGALIDTTGAMIEARLGAVNAQLAELKALSGKSQDAIQQMLTQLRGEKAAYDKTLASFQATRAVLSEQIRILLEHLSLAAFDALVGHARAAMQDAWTTHGLRVAMKTLFDGVLEAMDRANKQSQQIRSLVQGVYHKFHTDHGLARIQPAVFSLLPYRTQLQKLYEEAEAFRNSPAMVMTEAHFVIKRFFITLVSRTRELINECNRAAQAWSKAVMAPIFTQVREHKVMMDRRLETMKKVHENLDNLGGRIAELEASRQGLEDQLGVIRSMRRKLGEPPARDA